MLDISTCSHWLCSYPQNISSNRQGDVLFDPIRSATESASSAIAQHLVANPICADQYNADMFRILSRGRSSFHLRMLEATFIRTTDPILCRQKEFVRSLCLFQHGKIKGSKATNGEWTFGENPSSLSPGCGCKRQSLTNSAPANGSSR